MKDEIETRWSEGMTFEAEVDGHRLKVDSAEKFGGKNRGPRPKPLLLFSLAGCTGMDVISLLKKMRVEFDDFRINISGELTEEHPKYYHKIHIVYEFRGKNIDKSKVEKAINLSQDKYCGVSHMIRKAADISFEIQYA